MAAVKPTENEIYSARAVEHILRVMEMSKFTGIPLALCFSVEESRAIHMGRDVPTPDLKKILHTPAENGRIPSSEMKALLIIGKMRPGMIGETITLMDAVEDPYWRTFLWGLIAVSLKELGDPRSKEAFRKALESAEMVTGFLGENATILATETAITLCEFDIARQLAEKVADKKAKADLLKLMGRQGL